jgi:hypothetical protein
MNKQTLTQFGTTLAQFGTTLTRFCSWLLDKIAVPLILVSSVALYSDIKVYTQYVPDGMLIGFYATFYMLRCTLFAAFVAAICNKDSDWLQCLTLPIAVVYIVAMLYSFLRSLIAFDIFSCLIHGIVFDLVMMCYVKGSWSRYMYWYTHNSVMDYYSVAKYIRDTKRRNSLYVY